MQLIVNIDGSIGVKDAKGIKTIGEFCKLQRVLLHQSVPQMAARVGTSSLELVHFENFECTSIEVACRHLGAINCGVYIFGSSLKRSRTK